MVNWGAVCRPKEFGGLGIVHTRIMNDCLLAKWIWKIHSANNELWFRIIKAKYFPRGVFKEAKVLHGSQFWKNIQKVKKICLISVQDIRLGMVTVFLFGGIFGWEIVP